MAQLIIPPWLRPAEPAVHSYEAGAQMGQQLAAQEQRQQLAQREEMRREQEALINQQYNEQQMRLGQQEEQRKQQEFQLKAQDAARSYAAQQSYQQAVQGGMDPSKALAQFGPSFGLPFSGLAQALSRQSNWTPGPSITDPTTGRVLLNTAPNRYTEGRAGGGNAGAYDPSQPVHTGVVLDPSGQPIQGAYAVPTGRPPGYAVRNMPGYDQPGYLSPQARAQIQELQKQRTLLEAARNDPGKPQFQSTYLQVKKEQPSLTGLDLQGAVDEKFEQQIDAIDARIEQISHGGSPATGAGVPAPTGNIRRVVSVEPVQAGRVVPPTPVPAPAPAPAPAAPQTMYGGGPMPYTAAAQVAPTPAPAAAPASEPTAAAAPPPAPQIDAPRIEKMVDAYTNIRRDQTTNYNLALAARLSDAGLAKAADDLGIKVKVLGDGTFETQDKRATNLVEDVFGPRRVRSGALEKRTIDRQRLRALVLDELVEQQSILRQ